MPPWTHLCLQFSSSCALGFPLAKKTEPSPAERTEPGVKNEVGHRQAAVIPWHKGKCPHHSFLQLPGKTRELNNEFQTEYSRLEPTQVPTGQPIMGRHYKTLLSKSSSVPPCQYPQQIAVAAAEWVRPVQLSFAPDQGK